MAQETTFPGTAAWLRGQWSNPTDIFTVLLIIGGDVVQRAIAQLSGGSLTPVSFSFGWVSYAVSALLSAVGENRLMPEPDFPCLAINAKSGYARQNKSWVLSRILRDFEHWRNPEIDLVEKTKLDELNRLENIRLAELDDPQEKRKQFRIGLRVSIYDRQDISGKPAHDRVHCVGFAIILVQVAVAAVPFGLYKEWLIFFVTCVGTLLALASGALHQWQEEKYGVRRLESPKTVVLTTGNGSHDVLVIREDRSDIDLEALAGPHRDLNNLTLTSIYSFMLAAGWIVLLICVAGNRQHTWYLLGVGLIGILHNVLVAGLPRKPEAFGIKIQYKEAIVEEKVMAVLIRAETDYLGLGAALVPVFFPGELRLREVALWKYAKRRSMAFDKANEEYEKHKETLPPAVAWPMPPLKGPDDAHDIPTDGPYVPPRPQQGEQAVQDHAEQMAPAEPAKGSQATVF